MPHIPPIHRNPFTRLHGVKPKSPKSEFTTDVRKESVQGNILA
jgi:hypothetical protein